MHDSRPGGCNWSGELGSELGRKFGQRPHPQAKVQHATIQYVVEISHPDKSDPEFPQSNAHPTSVEDHQVLDMTGAFTLDLYKPTQWHPKPSL